MSKNTNVLERSVLQAGKVFVEEGEDNFRAFVIQNGEVRAFKTQEGERQEIAEYGPGSIIAEMSLLVDEPQKLSYEATETTTVITITRQDFQKTLSRTDKTIQTVLDHVIKKLSVYENKEIDDAIQTQQMDEQTKQLINGLFRNVSEDRKVQYQKSLGPHINGLITGIKKIKEQK